MRREKLLSNKPAPIMSMNARATSVVINNDAARRLERVDPRTPQVIRAEANAGASPNSRQTRHDIAIVNARARPSTPILARPEPIRRALWFMAEDAAGLNATRSFTPH